MGAKKVFVLTYKPEYFKKLGFKRVKNASLPHKIWAECINCSKFPDYPEAHYNLGIVLADIPDRLPEAVAHLKAALRIMPDDPEMHNSLGSVLGRIPGRLPEAISEYEAALRIRPDYSEAHYNLGIALADIPGRRPEAIAQFQAALKIRPDWEPARQMLNQLRAAQP